MGALIFILICVILVILVGALIGALIGLPILIHNVKETRRKHAEEYEARKRK